MNREERFQERIQFHCCNEIDFNRQRARAAFRLTGSYLRKRSIVIYRHTGRVAERWQRTLGGVYWVASPAWRSARDTCCRKWNENRASYHSIPTCQLLAVD